VSSTLGNVRGIPPADPGKYLKSGISAPVWTDIDPADVPTTPGSGDLHYTHTQGAPATSWIVSHMLNKFPSVTVVDTGNTAILPDIHYVDANNVILTFGSATTGKAYFN
jgi:hypothetical protein